MCNIRISCNHSISKHSGPKLPLSSLTRIAIFSITLNISTTSLTDKGQQITLRVSIP